MKELEDCLREALEESPYGIVTNDTALETARKYASELLRQRDELREALQLLMAGVNRLPPLTGIHGALENQYKIAEAAIKNTER